MDDSVRIRLAPNRSAVVSQEDITTISCDVIVSSDNTLLSMTAGVGYAIRKAGGPVVSHRRRPRTGKTVPKGEKCELGTVLISDAGRLDAQRILHAATVDWDYQVPTTARLVSAITTKCLEIAISEIESLGRSVLKIALPLIGTGAGGLGYADSLRAILEAVRDSLALGTRPIEVLICIDPYGGPSVASLADVMQPLRVAKVATSEGATTMETFDAPLISPLSQVNLSEEDILTLPAPVAMSFFAATNQTSGGERFRAWLDVGETLVKFLSSCAVAFGVQPAHQSTSLMMADLIKNRPSLGDWTEMLRSHLDALRRLDDRVASAIANQHGKRTDVGRFLLEKLPNLRNTLHGHGPPPSSEVLESRLPEMRDPLTQLIIEMSKYWPYQLLTPLSFDFGEGENFNYVVRVLRGPFAVFPTEIACTDLRLRTKRVYLRHKNPDPLQPWISMDPFVEFMVCPTCQHDELFIVDSFRDQTFKFKALLNGHEVEASRP
jgi:O-acetyl-ADP-ribose deacetylase (regulator of RNase III)